MTADLILELYQAFADAAPAFTAQGLDPIAIIDRHRGQPLNPEQFEYFPLPALFISQQASWQREGNVYNGDLHLTFHLVTEPTWDTSSIATNKEAGMKYFRFIAAVRKVLESFRSQRIGTLIRTADSEVDSGVIVYETLGYRCTFYEDDGQDEKYPETEIEGYSLRKAIVRNL